MHLFSRDPVIEFYRKMAVPTEKETHLPVFSETMLRLALNQVMGKMPLESKHLMLYRKLLLFSYANEYKTVDELTQIMICFREETVKNIIYAYDDILVEWKEFVNKHLKAVILKDAFFELLFEWTKRYMHFFGAVDAEQLRSKGTEIQRILNWDCRFNKSWLTTFQTMLTHRDLRKKSTDFEIFSADDLSIIKILNDIKYKLNPLVLELNADYIHDDTAVPEKKKIKIEEYIKPKSKAKPLILSEKKWVKIKNVVKLEEEEATKRVKKVPYEKIHSLKIEVLPQNYKPLPNNNNNKHTVVFKNDTDIDDIVEDFESTSNESEEFGECDDGDEDDECDTTNDTENRLAKDECQVSEARESEYLECLEEVEKFPLLNNDHELNEQFERFEKLVENKTMTEYARNELNKEEQLTDSDDFEEAEQLYLERKNKLKQKMDNLLENKNENILMDDFCIVEDNNTLEDCNIVKETDEETEKHDVDVNDVIDEISNEGIINYETVIKYLTALKTYAIVYEYTDAVELLDEVDNMFRDAPL